MKSGVRSTAFLCLLLALLLAAFVELPWHQQRSLAAPLQQTTQPNKFYLPYVSSYVPVVSPAPPLVSTSMYMLTKDSTSLANEGCALGKRDLDLPGRQDSVVVLAFGYPQKSPSGVYGTHGYGYPARSWTMAEITAAVENFGYAYWKCVGADFDSHLRIGVGTNNYNGDVNVAVNYSHGVVWANMVSEVNNWFVNSCTRGCDGQVDAVGANDIELSWNTYEATKNWLDGYAAVTKYPLYNFGALEGCPWFSHSNYTCYWRSVEKAWYVVWGSPPVQPLPEIYLESGVNAQQWYLMSVYSYNNHGQKMQFVGPMTQVQACTQEGVSSCPDLKNPPAQAWWQLYNLLNGDARTAGEALPFSTDIKWLGW